MVHCSLECVYGRATNANAIHVNLTSAARRGGGLGATDLETDFASRVSPSSRRTLGLLPLISASSSDMLLAAEVPGSGAVTVAVTGAFYILLTARPVGRIRGVRLLQVVKGYKPSN